MIYIDITKKLHGAYNEMQLQLRLRLEKGDFLAVTGASGSGKTTFLRILAGLEKAQGEIKVANEVWQSHRSFLPPQKRSIGFVFQDYALFENMTVRENLLYVTNDKELADHLLVMTGMKEFAKRYPKSLSGGQKQRVALCRAMMRRPKLLLMDEPLSALDHTMRTVLQNEILAFHKEFETTTIFVSHDPSEIYRLASYVMVIDHGKIIQEGTPKEVLLKTSGSQKFTFVGEVLDIYKADVLYIAVVAVSGQIVEVVITSEEAKNLYAGQKVSVSAKAFAPVIKPLQE